jgi:methyl-accepting chemotaxis protein
MSLSNIGIGRKLAIGFACILVAVAVMNATLFSLLRAADHAAGENAAFYKTIGDLDRSARAAAEESRASRGYIIARQEDPMRASGGQGSSILG